MQKSGYTNSENDDGSTQVVGTNKADNGKQGKHSAAHKPESRLFVLRSCQSARSEKGQRQLWQTQKAGKKEDRDSASALEPLISCPKKAERRWTRAWKADRRPVQDGRKK